MKNLPFLILLIMVIGCSSSDDNTHSKDFNPKKIFIAEHSVNLLTFYQGIYTNIFDFQIKNNNKNHYATGHVQFKLKNDTNIYRTETVFLSKEDVLYPAFETIRSPRKLSKSDIETYFFVINGHFPTYTDQFYPDAIYIHKFHIYFNASNLEQRMSTIEFEIMNLTRYYDANVHVEIKIKDNPTVYRTDTKLIPTNRNTRLKIDLNYPDLSKYDIEYNKIVIEDYYNSHD